MSKLFSKTRDYTAVRADVNNETEIEHANFFLDKITSLDDDMQGRLLLWEETEDLYRSKRASTGANDPNSFMPIILPIVEGQTSSLVQTSISARVSGVGMADQSFAATGQIITDWTYRQIKIKQVMKTITRRYLKFGNALLYVGWDADKFDKFGSPAWECPEVSKVYIDGKIKDPANLQKAEYIIREIGQVSLNYIEDKYGKEMADAVGEAFESTEYGALISNDNANKTTIYDIWHRLNTGKLQRMIMSASGIVLDESDCNKSYYKYTDDNYPFMFGRLYPVEGELYGFGDGELLAPLQNLVNKLYDEVVTACKYNSQGKTFVDPNANADNDMDDNDPSHWIYCDNPHENIKNVPGGNISSTVWNLIQNIFARVEYITRFSAMMSGTQPGKTMSATQAGLQVQQGNTGIEDKKSDLSTMISDATIYSLQLCMEFWDSAQALRISDNKDDFEWVDAKQLTKIPVLIPPTKEFEEKYRKKNGKLPRAMQYKNETKKVAFDIAVSIGEGLPTSKVAMYNIILSLAQLSLPNKQGQPVPILSREQTVKLIEKYLGIPIEDDQPPIQQMQQKMQMPIKEQNNVQSLPQQ